MGLYKTLRMYKTSNATVMVASGEGNGQCPTAKVTSQNVRFKDDYKGRVFIPKNLSKKLFI